MIGKNSFLTKTNNGFTEKLKTLSSKVEKNAYIKYTSNKLKQLIEDAESPYIVLFIGKEKAGKTSLINALIGRNILPEGNRTHVNTLIRYGKKERIKAIFVDGTIVHFDMKHLHLFIDTNTLVGDILRKYLSYIEIYIDCEILKNVIFIDSAPLEAGQKGDLYISETLIQRADDVFWVLNHDTVLLQEELDQLKKIHQMGKKPFFILNTSKYEDKIIEDFIASEKKRYGDFVEEFMGVSIQQAMEAKKSHNMQLYIDSHINVLHTKINHLSKQNIKRAKNIAFRFKQWIELFEREVKLIPEREPYLSAANYMKNLATFNNTIERSSYERDLKILSEYEKEYAHISQIFKNIQTLYQLLQVLEFEKYLKDDRVDLFVTLAIKYHEKVREYRKLHSEYMLEYQYFEKQEKKLLRKKFVKPLIQDNSNEINLLLKKAEHLNQLQCKCKDAYNSIKRLELDLLNDLYNTQDHINDLTQQQLEKIMNKAHLLNSNRKKQQRNIEKYVNKLNEFQCIREIQEFLQQEMKPLLENESLPYSQEELHHVLSTIDHISNVDFSTEALLSNITIDSIEQNLTISVDFEEKYSFYPLNLTESDIVSEIPPIPMAIDFQQILNFDH
jgi:Dynamin family